VLVLPGEEAIEFCLDFMEQQPRDAVLTYWHTTSPGFYEERILEAHKLLRAERANRTLAG
jgi:hypothetical protein